MPRPRKVRPALTKRAIDDASPAIRDRFLWDGVEHGLGVKVTPAGSKIFILQKSVQGRLKRITIGAYGDLSLDAARVQARRLNGEIAIGRDPVREARSRRENEDRQLRLERTMDDLWARYLVEVTAVENKPATIAKKTRMWKRRLQPSIGNRKVKDVTDRELGDLIRSPLQLDRKDVIVGGKAEAGNLYRLLHHMFRKALAWGIRPRELGNPLDEIAEPKVSRRERLLTKAEIGALLRALDHPSKESPAVAASIKAALLTGARISEILSLQWSHIRPDELELHLPDTKTGFSRRPVPAEAIAVMESLGKKIGSPYVFRAALNPSAPLPYATVQKAFRRLCDRAGIANCTLHTLRHWFSTVTANTVSNPRVGMVLTGHRSHTAYMAYVHADREQSRAFADQIGALTASLRENDDEVDHVPDETD